MKYFSTFSGIGGFELGFPEYWECVGFSEIDKYAKQIYQKHFPNHKDYGDIRKINPSSIPDFELLCGGFPCQAFSIAGRRRGFDDTRGTLFFEIARIVREKQPRLLLLENVKGLLSHDKGRTFETILRTLYELGYDVQWQVFNSKNFGVPQNRERVFIVGYLRGECRPKVFSFREEPSEDSRRVGEDIAYCLDANYHKGTNTLQKGRRQLIQIKGGSQGNRVYDPEGISCTLASGAGGLGAKTGLYKVITHYGHKNKKPTTHKISPTLKAQSHGHEPMVKNKEGIRRLTPLECERLQGLPDNWTEGLSDTQRYKTIGNGVTVNVIRYLASVLDVNYQEN